MEAFIHYIGGNFVSTENAVLSAFDLSLLRGFGIFEYLRTYQRHLFHLQEHLDRMQSSAKLMSLPLPHTDLEIHQIITELIERNPPIELGIKLFVTGGDSTDGISPGRPKLLILTSKAPQYNELNYLRGVKTITFNDNTSRPIPRCKSINYFSAVIGKQMAQKKRGGRDALSQLAK